MRKELLAFKAEYKNPPLIGYLPSLYPDSGKAEELMNLAYKSGLRFIETGLPTENPYLDGAVIQKALLDLSGSEKTAEDFLSGSGRSIKSSGMHGAAMLYQETLEEYGCENILHDAGECGIEALLVPNISNENRKKLYSAAIDTDVEIVNFIGFNSSLSEIEEIVALTTGFLYMQSTDGSTGGQFVADRESEIRIKHVKEIAADFELPVALGFGINSSKDADTAAEIGADAVIVGTSFLKAAQSGQKEFTDFIRSFKPYLVEKVCSL